MSDHPRVQLQHLMQMGELNICNDIWLCIFTLIEPAEVGLIMALLSDRFDALVDMHFRTRKWTIGNLKIVLSMDDVGDEQHIVKWRKNGGPTKHFSLPQQSPPRSLVGFERISFFYIDHTVIAFVNRIQRLFNADATLNLDIRHGQNRSWNIVTQEIWPLIAPNIGGMIFDLGQLGDRASTLLSKCTKLRSICCSARFSDKLSNYRDEAFAGHALSNWIHTPLNECGHAKVLKFGKSCVPNIVRGMTEQLKETFLRDSTPVNYVVVLQLLSGIASFDLKNEGTRERLTIRLIGNNLLLIARSPIVRDEQQWTEWENEAVNMKAEQQKNLVDIHIGDMHIGPLSAAGPSQQVK
uniref:F-box domain-containing protein n=1 Tax=Globodera pallida TaxID=36090 RepID=A0A183BX72_GLOPA